MRGFADVTAQTTDGTIRGDIRDQDLALMPGVTVTARCAAGPVPVVALSDAAGRYRLLNLAPGTCTVTAQRPGFTKEARENIVVRAGLNVSLHFVMTVGHMAETVTVRAETPLLETSRAGQAVNASGELLQSLPLAARKHWSDFLKLAPGTVSTDTTGDQATLYFVHGAGSVSGSTTVDGADISSAVNPWTGYVALPDDTIADVQIRTGGLDASAPLGMGAAANVVTKSGTNQYRGSATWAYTSRSWMSTNTPGAGTSQTMTVNQPEAALGGPLQRDRWWFFGAYRRRLGTLGLSRPAGQIADMKAFVPTFEPFDNAIKANIVFAKITGQLGPTHQISGFYNYDATSSGKDTPLNTGSFTKVVIGGHATSTRVTSGWSNWLTSRLGFSWNDKGSMRSLVRGNVQEPSRPVWAQKVLSNGRLMGQTQLATLDNSMSETQSPYTKWTITGDATIYRTGWLGSHEVQVGAFLQPSMHRRDSIEYANGGVALEELVLRSPANPSSGTVPFHRRVYAAPRGVLAEGHFSDNAVYVQDLWRVSSRMTIALGLRADRIGRTDDLFGVELQRSVEVAPRVGVTYLLTGDERNAVRVSFMRLHDSANINQLSASGAGSQGAGAQTVGFVDAYDMDLDGTFELELPTPAASKANPNRVMDPRYHQPYLDEWAAGYRRQLPGQATLDVGFIHRDFRDRTALVEQNGIYDGVRFAGYRNENQQEIFLVTNNRWNWPVYNALEIVAAKRTRRLEILGSYTRVWSHLAGTWQPNDPASFIQPDAFAYGRGLLINDNRSSSLNNAYGTGLESPWSGPEWMEHVANVSGVYHGPWGIVVGSTYSVLSGWSSGPILVRIPAADPQFGPSRVVLSNGTAVSNPLATTFRFLFPTRGEGQFMLPPRHYLNLRLGREFRLRGGTRFEVDLDMFNLPNLAGFQGFLPAAHVYNTANYGKGGNVQPPRTVQLGLRFSF
jgi:hypothetical protein